MSWAASSKSWPSGSGQQVGGSVSLSSCRSHSPVLVMADSHWVSLTLIGGDCCCCCRRKYRASCDSQGVPSGSSVTMFNSSTATSLSTLLPLSCVCRPPTTFLIAPEVPFRGHKDHPRRPQVAKTKMSCEYQVLHPLVLTPSWSLQALQRKGLASWSV